MKHRGWARISAVGIGSAGPVDPSAGTVSPVNVPGWRGFPLVARVRGSVGDLPVELVGDGVAMTAAEHWQGAAAAASLGCHGEAAGVVGSRS
jgi:glucokinase